MMGTPGVLLLAVDVFHPKWSLIPAVSRASNFSINAPALMIPSQAST